MHDVKILNELVFEALAIYLMDKGYLDFARLYRLYQAKAFFVTRAKDNLAFAKVSAEKVDKASGLSDIVKIMQKTCPLVKHCLITLFLPLFID